MNRKSQSKTQLSLLLLSLILSVSLAYAASFTSGLQVYGSSGPVVQAGAANQLLNFSISNTDSSKNITQVQITLPSGFNYIANSNGTSAQGTGFALAGSTANFTPSGESQALWQYRKAITINGSTAAQANYQSIEV